MSTPKKAVSWIPVVYVPGLQGQWQLRRLDIQRCQLTNCSAGHLDLSVTFLVLLILSSVPKPGLLTQTQRSAVACWLCPMGTLTKENLSCPNWAPALPSQSCHPCRSFGCSCSAGGSSLRFRTRGHEPPQRGKAHELRTSGWDLERGPSRLSCTHKVCPSLSGSLSHPLLFQNTPETYPAHLVMPSACTMPSPPLPQAFVCPIRITFLTPIYPTVYPTPIQPGCN